MDHETMQTMAIILIGAGALVHVVFHRSHKGKRK